MSNRFKRKGQSSRPLSNSDKAKVTNLQKGTNQGFQVHDSLKELHEFFTLDQDISGIQFEPPFFNRGKPSGRDLARAKGTRR